MKEQYNLTPEAEMSHLKESIKKKTLELWGLTRHPDKYFPKGLDSISKRELLRNLRQELERSQRRLQELRRIKLGR